jgi:hypothetical protein
LRDIAGQYGLTKTSLARHKAAHVPAALALAQDAEDVARADDLLAQLRSLQHRSLAILEKAERMGDLKTALAGVREARGCLELLARLLGELDERPQVNIAISAEWVSLRATILRAVAPYPEASTTTTG